MKVFVNTITADRLSHSYLDDLRVVGAFTSLKEAFEAGLIDKDKNSPGRCWLRSLYPNEPELP